MIYTAPNLNEPERRLTEKERLRATDIVESMIRRAEAMNVLLFSPSADLRIFEERLLESGELADDLWTVLIAAWHEDGP